MHVGLLLLDLSKAFDCLPHRLPLCKLRAYGVSRDACSLLHSYLSSRFQRVKISAPRSDWAQMSKGVPQGSILGPMLFNIFINNLIYAVNDVCPLYNYADDNTLTLFHSDMEILRTKLEEGSNIALDWFDENNMQTNISKFQTTILRPKGSISNVTFCISESILTPASCVKLFGVKLIIACLLMTISRHFASVFPIKSMACVVSLSIWPLKTVSPYIMSSSLPILLTVIQSGIFAATEVCIC